jgi:hypothetical protein
VACYTVAGLGGAIVLAGVREARPGLVLLALLVMPRLLLLGWLENPEPRYTVVLFPVLAALGSIAAGWWVADTDVDLRSRSSVG